MLQLVHHVNICLGERSDNPNIWTGLSNIQGSTENQPNSRDKYGLTPLHYAGMRGNDDAAVDLLQLPNTNIEVI